MPLNLPKPIIYLITSGATTIQTTPDSSDFSQLLLLIKTAVAAEIPLLQIREKALSTRVLYDLTGRALEISRGTSTRILVNDRLDVALAAGAAGVQLTSQSLPANVVRGATPDNFLIGVSIHSVTEATDAESGGADFVVFGPVFETESKRKFGPPQGLTKLADVATAVSGLPVIAIGGIAVENVRECLDHGAAGIAAITLLNDSNNLATTVSKIQRLGATKTNG
ncbi:MAG TPA: thiamine phosphate synthase [Pyrinomonadaceae bacterium]|nr:thiamine phosphate synthase [Pyrinomonadaceae bacterium]